MIERSRDLISGQLTLDYFMQRAAGGWKLAAVEWIREVEDTKVMDTEPLQVPPKPAELPYGLQIAEDGLHIEENPLETAVLLLILEQIVKEQRITQIAQTLNAAGKRTRNGAPWSAPAVFDLLPRLIEAGPALLKSTDWQERRARKTPPN